jgi:hypothetical protein
MELSPAARDRCLRVGRIAGTAAGTFWTLFLLTRLGEDFAADTSPAEIGVVLLVQLGVGAWLGSRLGAWLARLLVGRTVKPSITLTLGLGGGALAGAAVLIPVWVLFYGLSHMLGTVDYEGLGLGKLLLYVVVMGALIGALAGAWLGAIFGFFVLFQGRR